MDYLRINASLNNLYTSLNGVITGSSPPSSCSNANVLAACAAASASTSHRAFDTAAAAAKDDESIGNVDSSSTGIVSSVWRTFGLSYYRRDDNIVETTEGRGETVVAMIVSHRRSYCRRTSPNIVRQ
jgi:hypothetical protein